MQKANDQVIKPVFVGDATIGFSAETNSIQVQDNKGSKLDLPLKDFHPNVFKRLHQFLSIIERSRPR
jgi:hypothetical protein